MQMKNNTTASQEKCIIRLLLYHFGVNLPVMLASYPVFRHMGMQTSLPFPSWYFQVLYILKLFQPDTILSDAIVVKRYIAILLFIFWIKYVINCFSYYFHHFWSIVKRFCFFFPCRNVILTQITFYFILEDFIFYWGHRILHTKWLYKHVHSVHHEYVESPKCFSLA